LRQCLKSPLLQLGDLKQCPLLHNIIQCFKSENLILTKVSIPDIRWKLEKYREACHLCVRRVCGERKRNKLLRLLKSRDRFWTENKKPATCLMCEI
jgi:hypothetical protein